MAVAARIVRPRSRTENLARGQNNQPFPEGLWQGTIDEVRVRSLDFLAQRTAEQLQKQGYDSADVEVVSLQIGSNRPVEVDGEADVGARKFFTPDLVIRDGQLLLEQEEPFPGAAWQIERSADQLVNLAVALGATEEVETDEGPADAVAPEFLQALIAGEFKGTEIVFKVVHGRTFTRKDGSTGVNENVETYMAAIL